MSPLPQQSNGVLAAELGEHTVLYDLVAEVVHVLNASASLVWLSCDGFTEVAQVVDPITPLLGTGPSDLAADIAACLEQLTLAGLVGRTGAVPEPVPMKRPPVSGGFRGSVHAVLDDGVIFRSDDIGLLTAIDDVLGPEAQREATVELGVEDTGESLVVRGWGDELPFASRLALLEALPSVLNQIAAGSTTCVALHAGCVRSPTGEVMLLPAVSGSGKTTLTAALVQAGWAYGTDEAVGLRAGTLDAVTYPKPLVLDATSRTALGLGASTSVNTAPAALRPDVEVLVGSAGPISRVVLPRYEPGASVSLSEPLEPREAVIAVLEHTLNLARVGQPGLEALCELADRVPVQHLVHGGVDAAVAALR